MLLHYSCFLGDDIQDLDLELKGCVWGHLPNTLVTIPQFWLVHENGALSESKRGQRGRICEESEQVRNDSLGSTSCHHPPGNSISTHQTHGTPRSGRSAHCLSPSPTDLTFPPRLMPSTPAESAGGGLGPPLPEKRPPALSLIFLTGLALT